MNTKIHKNIGRSIGTFVAIIILINSVAPAYARLVFTNDIFTNDSPTYKIGGDKDASYTPLSLTFGDINTQSLEWDTTKFTISGDLSLQQNELKDVVIEKLDAAPLSPATGQIYYNNITGRTYQWNGTAWKDFVAEPHANSHIDGTDDIPLATTTTKGLMAPTQVEALNKLATQGDEISRNTINVMLTLGTNVTGSVAYLTYDNPNNTTFVANIENTEYIIDDNPVTGIALVGGSNINPVLNYVYVRQDGMTAYVEASITDPKTQGFYYVPIGEVLLGTVGESSATYYYVENLTNYIRNFIGDTNNRLRRMGVLYLSGIQLTSAGLDIATTEGVVIHMHEELIYPAKDTTVDNMIDFYYNTYGALNNVNYDNGTGGNTAIGNGKFHKLFIWGDIYGGLHMERQRKPATNEYTSLAAAEDDADKVAVSIIPNQWRAVGFPIAHLILKQGDPNVLKVIDLRMGGGSGGTVVGGHTQNTDTGTTESTFTLNTNNTAGNINLIFGASLAKSLIWDATNTRFTLNSGLRVEGNEAVVGEIYTAGDHTAANSAGVLNLGRQGGNWQNLQWNTVSDEFRLSNKLNISGGLVTTGSATIGDNTGSVSIDSNDWDISVTGDMTGIGAITMDGLLTGSAGAILSGEVINLNNNSNFAVNIGTGTSTGTVNVGGGSNAVVINSSDWSISSTGAMTGISGITNDAAFTTSGGAVNINNDSNFATNINTGSSTETVSVGGGSNAVEINSSAWDITAAGVASGFTGLASTGTVNFSGASTTRIREVANAATADCYYVGEIVLSLNNNQIYACTATGTPGTWTSTAGAGAQDFESVYNTDSDKTLTTSNGAFTINTGTNDFIVTSNDWSVDASGNMNVNNFTANGNVVLGVGGTDTVAIDSSTWDISSAGLATGFTGFTSTGNINFVNANTFRIPQAASNPASCSVGQQYYNTSTNEIRVCIAVNTWSNLGSSTGANYTYAYNTTTQNIAIANTYQDVTFSSNGQINGWAHTPETANFTCGATGLYLVTVNVMTNKSTPGLVPFEIRALFNGVEIAGSHSGTSVQKDGGVEVTSNFLVYATSSQILKIQAASTSTASSIQPIGATAGTQTSAKITIMRLN